MTDETIQQDVSDADITDQVDGAAEASTEEARSNDPVSRRADKMSEIAAQRRAEVEADRKAMFKINNPDAEEGDLGEGSTESPPLEASTGQEGRGPAGAKEGVETEGAEVTAPPATKNGWRTRDDGQRVKTLMVNGEPKEFTEEQYDRMIQKDLAGDQKLRMANEIERSLAAKARALEEREKKLSQQPAPLPVDPGANDELKKLTSQYSELLLDGETDAANAKLVEIMQAQGRAQGPTPNLDQIVEQATTRAAERLEQRQAQKAHEKSVSDGWTEFKKEYTDVLDDPDALAFADIQVKNLRTRNPEWTPDKIIMEAGKITRERLGLGGGRQQPSTGGDGSDARAEREARKANLKPIPKSGSMRHKPSEKPVVDYSPAAKIERMRAGRLG